MQFSIRFDAFRSNLIKNSLQKLKVHAYIEYNLSQRAGESPKQRI